MKKGFGVSFIFTWVLSSFILADHVLASQNKKISTIKVDVLCQQPEGDLWYEVGLNFRSEDLIVVLNDVDADKTSLLYNDKLLNLSIDSQVQYSSLQSKYVVKLNRSKKDDLRAQLEIFNHEQKKIKSIDLICYRKNTISFDN